MFQGTMESKCRTADGRQWDALYSDGALSLYDKPDASAALYGPEPVAFEDVPAQLEAWDAPAELVAKVRSTWKVARNG